MVVLSTNIGGFSYADFQSGTHDDLRFTDETQTSELNYEVEKWDTNGSSYVWVQVPNLAQNTVIWALWGMASQTAPAYTTNGATWANGYVGVWHLPDGATLSAKESTANALVTTNQGVSAVAGKIDGGGHFNGSAYLDAGGSFNPDGSTPLTLSCWFKTSDTIIDPQSLISKDLMTGTYAGFTLGLNELTATAGDLGKVGVVWVEDATKGAYARKQTTTSYNDGQWHLATVVYDGSKTLAGTTIYVDGILRATERTDGADSFSGSMANAAMLEVGARDGAYQPYYGDLDEVRIAVAAHSADWVWATWFNTASNSDFVTVATVATVSSSNGAAGLRTDAATQIGATTAVLNGYLCSTGASPTTVFAYWGPTDGGTNAAAWAHALSLGTRAAAAFSNSVTGLNANSFYYFRHQATNDEGSVWSPASAGFSTAAPQGPIYRFW